MDREVFLIGITGPSCSGKSTIVEELKKKLSDVLIINLDDYWHDKSTFPIKLGYRNWEIPDNLKFDLLLKNLEDLKQGKETEAPNCEGFNQVFGTQILKPKPIIIVEGFLLFYHNKIRDLFDLKIYVNLSDEDVINRRIKRNRSGRSLEESGLYYREILVTEYKKYGEPSKAYCNLILEGNENIDSNVQEILKKFGSKNLNNRV